METSIAKMHDSMRRVTDTQTHLRLREATHRMTAEFMNERVQVRISRLVLFCTVRRTVSCGVKTAWLR